MKKDRKKEVQRKRKKSSSEIHDTWIEDRLTDR